MCIPSQIVSNCYAKILYKNGHSLLSIGSFCLIDPFPPALYCIWLVGISCPIFLLNSLDDLYPPALKFHSVLSIFDFAIANAVVSKEPYFWVNVCWDIINIQQEWCPEGRGPNLILLHLLLHAAAWNRGKIYFVWECNFWRFPPSILIP